MGPRLSIPAYRGFLSVKWGDGRGVHFYPSASMGIVPECICKKELRPPDGTGEKGSQREEGFVRNARHSPSLAQGPPLDSISFHPPQAQKHHQGSHIFSSLSSWQAESENMFVEFLSPNLSRFASKRKRIQHFLQSSLLSQI